MRERIARTLCDDTLSRWRSPIALHDEPWKEFLPAADAVLAAMRTPTAYMVDMGCVKWLRPLPGVDDPRLFGEKIIDVWHGMIGAASSDQIGNPETQAMLTAASPSLPKDV